MFVLVKIKQMEYISHVKHVLDMSHAQMATCIINPALQILSGMTTGKGASTYHQHAEDL